MATGQRLTPHRFGLQVGFLGVLVLLMGTSMMLAFGKIPGRELHVQKFLAYVAWLSLAGMLGAMVLLVWAVMRFYRRRL